MGPLYLVFEIGESECECSINVRCSSMDSDYSPVFFYFPVAARSSYHYLSCAGMHAKMAADGVVEFMSRTLSHMKEQVTSNISDQEKKHFYRQIVM
jgi:hypothetical protein